MNIEIANRLVELRKRIIYHRRLLRESWESAGRQ